MSIKVFQTNSTGKIEFTRSELEKLLNEIYKEGFREGEEKAKNNYWTWTAPSHYTSPSYNYRDLTFYKNNPNNTEKTEPDIAVKTLETKADEPNQSMIYGCSGVGAESKKLDTLVDKILEEAFRVASSEQLPLNKTPVNNVFTDLEREVRGL